MTLLLPRRRLHVPLLGASLMLIALATSAEIRDGVVGPGSPNPSPIAGPVAQPRVAEVLIGFDDFVAPGAFGFTTPLRDRYLPLGVRFRGGPGTDGGAVLNATSNFGVTGYSGMNFLAFNSIVGTIVPNSYIAALPEVIVFTDPAAAVSVRVGSASSAGSTVRLDAFDGASVLVASNALVLGTALQTLTVSAPGIRQVVVSGPSVMVLDDLRFTPGGVVPVKRTSWARIKRLFR